MPRWALARSVLCNRLMLYTFAVILLVLWALGLAMSYTLGGILHLLLVVAIVLVVFQLITGRRVA